MIDEDSVDGRRGGRTGFAIAALLVAALLPMAASVVGHAGSYNLTLEASEDCSGDRTYCFDVTEGSFDEVEPGMEIQVTIVNPQTNDLDHNLHITQIGQASSDQDTDASAAEMNTRNVAPGEQANFEYFVSQGSDGLYLWCDVGGHETQGMYLEVPFTSDASTDSGNETNDSPAFGALAVLAAAGAALALRRDR